MPNRRFHDFQGKTPALQPFSDFGFAARAIAQKTISHLQAALQPPADRYEQHFGARPTITLASTLEIQRSMKFALTRNLGA